MTGGWAVGAAALGTLLLFRPSAVARGPSRIEALVVGVVLVLAAVAVLVHRLPVVPVLAVVSVVVVGARRVRRRRREAAALRRTDELIEACSGLAEELRAGRPPLVALRAVADDWAEFEPIADAAVLGSDVAAAMRRLGERPGAVTMRWLAASWAVSERTGAGLAGALEVAVRTMTEDRATARVLEVELASAQATAKLLCVLPAGVLLIGRGAGGDPVGFLVRTVPGSICLVLGLLLAWSGLAWIDRIGRSR